MFGYCRKEVIYVKYLILCWIFCVYFNRIWYDFFLFFFREFLNYVWIYLYRDWFRVNNFFFCLFMLVFYFFEFFFKIVNCYFVFLYLRYCVCCECCFSFLFLMFCFLIFYKFRKNVLFLKFFVFLILGCCNSDF